MTLTEPPDPDSVVHPARLAPHHQRGAAARRPYRPLVSALLLMQVASAAAAGGSFLDDAQVRDALVGHTLKGTDWIEYYTASGDILGKVRYLGIRDYRGKWSLNDGRVCYVYGDPSVDTCSWLRREADRVTHHLQDGSLKKDGVSQRLPGNRLDQFGR